MKSHLIHYDHRHKGFIRSRQGLVQQIFLTNTAFQYPQYLRSESIRYGVMNNPIQKNHLLSQGVALLSETTPSLRGSPIQARRPQVHAASTTKRPSAILETTDPWLTSIIFATQPSTAPGGVRSIALEGGSASSAAERSTSTLLSISMATTSEANKQFTATSVFITDSPAMSTTTATSPRSSSIYAQLPPVTAASSLLSSPPNSAAIPEPALSAGAKAAIGIGATIAFLIFTSLLALFFFHYGKRSASQARRASKPPTPPPKTDRRPECRIERLPIEPCELWSPSGEDLEMGNGKGELEGSRVRGLVDTGKGERAELESISGPGGEKSKGLLGVPGVGASEGTGNSGTGGERKRKSEAGSWLISWKGWVEKI
ncbi:hypothetical protein BJ875DRAFT_519163 [Amylocarpus encephaloides]|uniref:Uncharacterized protein n=1 Tax=Amylocarpus encephaloides TaxID=45428 RepID=A0A9P7YBI7_9HELO|nr:hypothetical protein BJ875DRAFT_519163 [Amylocarpus encephaloides]